MDQLPLSFQEDMYFDICREMFHKSFLFHDLDEACLRAVSKIVSVALYNPDMILCRYGGYANQMYYILQGECRAMSKFESSKTAAILRAGSIIGETNLFFSSPYTISVETRTCCQFIILQKEDLMMVLNKFPNELNVLRSRSQVKTAQKVSIGKNIPIISLCISFCKKYRQKLTICMLRTKNMESILCVGFKKNLMSILNLKLIFQLFQGLLCDG